MPVFDIFKRLVGTNAVSERRGDDRMRATLGARVLVVDDSATIRAVLGKMLAQDGYEVLKAPDGENAVEMAQSQYPDLIFLDIVLPGMSGFAVLRALRRDTRTRTTPIIMMSGNQQATEQFYVQRFGADGFIKKPFGRAEVFHSIRSLVQAGRMSARADAYPADSIPDGMTPEEWDSIPDVAMPDEAHAAGHPVVLDDVQLDEPVDAPAPAAPVPAPVTPEPAKGFAAAPPVTVAAPAPVVAKENEAMSWRQVAAAPEPVAEAPAAPEPVAETPAAPEPVAEAPAAPEPVAETPATPEPVAEAPAAPEPVAETPAAPELVAETVAAPEPVAEMPAAPEPVAETAAAPELVAETVAAPEPVAEMPAAPEPVAATSPAVPVDDAPVEVVALQQSELPLAVAQPAAAAPVSEPVQQSASAHFNVTPPADVHAVATSGKSASWTMRALSLVMRRSVTTEASGPHNAGMPLTLNLRPPAPTEQAGKSNAAQDFATPPAADDPHHH